MAETANNKQASKLIIIGASGHGRVIADIAALTGYTEIVFLDDNASVAECGGWPVAGPSSLAEEMDGDFFVAIGNSAVRRKIMERLSSKNFPVLIHPSAVIASNAVIGDGTVIAAGAVVNPGAKMGRGMILNTCASIDHDCVCGDYVHIAAGAHLCGTVTVGEGTWIGAGAVISNNINICADCLIGVGSAVIKDITEPGTYLGVPAKQL